ncbi:MAG: SIS domain-containing protein [Archaeoglobus sp.]|nr:SIS domain-containing protein [Archaeoglobus sp.]
MERYSDLVIDSSNKLIRHISSFPEILGEQREKFDEFINLLEKGKAIHVFGVGRSGAVALCFAIRLKHFEKDFGHKVWWLGDEVREKIGEGDILIIFSGSGETAEAFFIAKKGKEAGATLILITSYPESSIGEISDLIIRLPGGMEKAKGWKYLEAQVSNTEFYGGGEFELMAYLLQETLIMAIGRYKSISKGAVVREHFRDSV